METPVRDRLKKKSKKRNQGSNESTNLPEQPDILAMMNQVSDLLKKNPEIISKVNKMVSGVMNNKELLENLSSQFQQQMGNVQVQDQTLVSNSETPIRDAVSKESKQ